MRNPNNLLDISLVREAAERGWDILTLRKLGYTVATLVEAFGAQRVASEGQATAVEIYSAIAPRIGIPRVEFFLGLGYRPDQLLGLFGPAELRMAGVPAGALRGCFSAQQLLDAGYTAPQLVEGWG